MRHYLDDEQGLNRPSLLTTSNPKKLLTTDIPSILDKPLPLKNSIKFRRKKIWKFALLGSTAICLTSFIYNKNLQELTQKLTFNNEIFQVNFQSADTDKKMDNSNSLTTALGPNETQALVHPNAENSNEVLIRSAILVDVTSEKTNAENMNTIFKDLNPRQIITPITTVNLSKASPINVSTTKNILKQVITADYQAITSSKLEVKRANSHPLIGNEIQIKANQEGKNNTRSYDSDIVLLSAIVANGKTPPQKSTEHYADIVGTLPASQKLKTRISSLDIVERSVMDDTTNLLSRCEKLGGLEAKLCQARICSSSLLTEPICYIVKD